MTSYIIESLLCQQPNTGASLLLATPLVSHHRNSENGGDMMACSPHKVVIKVLPRSREGDDPLCEIGAMCLLDQNREGGEEGIANDTNDSSHVIRLVDAMEDDEFIYLVLPYMAGGDLFDKVEGNNPQGLPEATAANYIRQMAKVRLVSCCCSTSTTTTTTTTTSTTIASAPQMVM